MQCFTPQRSWEFIQSSALLSVQSNADLSSCLHTHSFLFRLATYKYKVQLTGRQTGDQGLLLGLQFGFSEEHTLTVAPTNLLFHFRFTTQKHARGSKAYFFTRCHN